VITEVAGHHGYWPLGVHDEGKEAMTLRPQYVVDEKGRRRSVLLPIKEFRELLESAQDVIDATLIDEVKDDPRVAWDDVKARRRRGRRP
jgi:hypothetical protein